MDNQQFRELVTAKADQMYDHSRPGFVHALREPHHRKGWTLLTFPSDFQCATNSSPIETELIYNEVFGSKDYFRGAVRLSDGDTIVDVGANVGVFTLYLTRSLKNPTIHAIEPVPDTYQVLEENIARFSHSDVRLYNVALGATANSTAEIVVFPNMTGNSTSHPEMKDLQRQTLAAVFADDELEYIYAQQRVVVPSTTLSTIISESQIETIDLLKIDTEGAEVDVLRGIDLPDWDRIKQLAIEVHNESITLPMVAEILAAHGLTANTHDSTRDPFGTVVVSAVR